MPVWEFFTATEIFKNEPNQNVRPITGSDKEDIDEIIESAKRKVRLDLNYEACHWLLIEYAKHIF